MKTTNRIIALLVILVVSLATLSAQSKKEKKELKKEAVKELIVSENYKIEVNMALPMSGRNIHLNSLYSIEIRNDSIFSYLPYYGRAYSIPYDGGEGLHFKAPVKEYKMELNKKDEARIQFSARSPEDNFEFRVIVFPNGKASINVNMQNRQSIGFQGELYMPGNNKK